MGKIERETNSLSYFERNKYDEIAESNEFQVLDKKKRAFLITSISIMMIYFFTLPIMAGYFKPLMMKEVPVFVNFGYLFATSQFIVAWICAAIYTKKSNQFDDMISEIYERYIGGVQNDKL
ncbi:DUF485 domain-containing protein [Peribacillus frigoritolerans]|uniref:DUF485 domain-containing protein n=1 Tax=Peribacillus frigoritolerans TaxID=450367 RepID=UPI0021CF68F1|nr:DUF485 domain-containing protein [Peribacillus frigoritolerans]MCU6598943.1 DUF485 domain-containing protein [Peribacillus frigoritolerans]